MNEEYLFQFDDRADKFLHRGYILHPVSDKAGLLVSVLKQEAEKSLATGGDHLRATADRIDELPEEDVVEIGSTLLVGEGEAVYFDMEGDDGEPSVTGRFTIEKGQAVTGTLGRLEIQYIVTPPNVQSANEVLPTVCYILDDCKLINVGSGDTVCVFKKEAILPIDLFDPTDVHLVENIRPSLN